MRTKYWMSAVVLLMCGVATTLAQTSPPGSDTKPSTTIPVVMTLEAGRAFWKSYPGAEKTLHVGMGHIAPFGTASYSCGMGFPEQKEFPKPGYFNDAWESAYHTDLFCVYSLPQGKIYAWDGITGSLIPGTATEDRSDYLINVVVGGTGLFEGATGMLLGKTVGAGSMKEVAPKESLPEVIIKSMEGYVKLPREIKEYQPYEVRNKNQ